MIKTSKKFPTPCSYINLQNFSAWFMAIFLYIFLSMFTYRKFMFDKANNYELSLSKILLLRRKSNNELRYKFFNDPILSAEIIFLWRDSNNWKIDRTVEKNVQRIFKMREFFVISCLVLWSIKNFHWRQKLPFRVIVE